ncbi:heme-binding protein A precursor [Variibacter gotjawalensis]|uniref:Heme-binding protein A n=1 Tax=Variibacter gotjawalensis TaxID=1333996 RepID=A0A0S3PSY6_9BRAD|nr:peptide/nickel transport system substrate-binding protein [Variibacter gotjawalensis]RZS51198.1 peptide/nickel transport system substrate-binding protein [Variibacter gotjawalensis]BAT59033.1 heme-binding protein A precursor [Variibacter gotjawalensis]
MRASAIKLTAAIAVFAAATGVAHAGKRDNSIRFAYDQVAESIDPYMNNVRIGVILGQQVWDTLIYRDPKTNEYKGQLATAWKWIDDRTLEVDLRQGVKFHNGEEFDADDVVYTLNFVVKPDSKVVTQQNVDWIERAEKIDKYKARIITKRPFPAAIEYLAGPVVIHPNEYYEKVGPRGMNEKPVGSGPYKVVEHQVGKLVRMERNADYFKDSPKPQPTIQKVEIRFIPDRQTQIAEIMAGGVDMIMNVALDQATQIKAVPQLQVVSGETMRIAFLNFNSMENTPSPQLRDIRVRKAILHAIDRETMVKQVVGEGARVLKSQCFPSQFGCATEGIEQYNYDPAKAKALLAEAGFPNGFDLDLYAYRERNQTEAMIGYLRAVGIKANLRFMQYAAMRETARAGKAAFLHQTWGSFSVNDVSASTPVYYKNGPDDLNRDPEVIAALDKGDSSIDPEARKAAYKEALARIASQALSVPLFSLTTYYVATKDLNFVAYPDEMPRFWEMTFR